MTMPHPPEHKLRWYQYKLSSLFILTILVCLASSWYATVMHNAAKRRKAIAEIEKLGGYVRYYDASKPNSSGEPPRWYSWMRKLHGDEHLGNAVCADLGFTQITDAGLEHLEGLTNLEVLLLDGTRATDAGLMHLKGLTNLEVLYLDDTQITDEGVKKLQEALPKCMIIHIPPEEKVGPKSSTRLDTPSEPLICQLTRRIGL
jgi:hypothetical protein